MPLALTLQRVDLANLDTPLLVLALPAHPALTVALGPVDANLGGALARTLDQGHFRGGKGEVLHLAGGPAGPRRVLLVGIGANADRPAALQRAAAIASRRARDLGATSLTWYAGAA